MEPKHFDEEKEKKAERAERRAKRKKSTAESSPASKRPRVALVSEKATSSNATQAGADQIAGAEDSSTSDSDLESGDDDVYADKHKSYNAPLVAQNASRREKQQASKDLDAVMNDMVNPKAARYNCSRKPPNILFGNDKAARGKFVRTAIVVR